MKHLFMSVIFLFSLNSYADLEALDDNQLGDQVGQAISKNNNNIFNPTDPLISALFLDTTVSISGLHYYNTPALTITTDNNIRYNLPQIDRLVLNNDRGFGTIELLGIDFSGGYLEFKLQPK